MPRVHPVHEYFRIAICQQLHIIACSGIVVTLGPKDVGPTFKATRFYHAIL